MKKHFLLFLMAFMSITAFAADISEANMSVANVTYGGSTVPGFFVTWGGEKLTKDTEFSWDGKYYTTDACTAQATPTGSTTPYTISTLPAGTYYVKITGITTGGFSGYKIGSFAVEPKQMTSSDISVTTDPASPSFTYDGTAKTFTAVVVKDGSTTELVSGKDYTVSYQNNTNAGTATAAGGPKLVVSGKGNYTGDKITGFAIAGIDLPELSTTGAYTFKPVAEANTPVYTGVEATTLPIFEVKAGGDKTLVEGTDYEIRWYNGSDVLSTGSGATLKYTKPVNAGTFTAKIFGKGNYNSGSGIGDGTWTLTINKAPITVTPKDIEVVYNGKNQANQSSKARTAGQLEFSGIVSADAAKAELIKGDIDYSGAKAGYPNASGSWGVATVPGTYEMIVNPSTVKMKSTPSEPKSNNYTIGNFNKGTLTILKAKLKLASANATKKVGEADPKFELAPTTGLVTGDEITGVTYTREEGEGVDKTYKITPNYSAAKVMRPDATDATKPATEVTEYYEFALAETQGKLTIEQGGILVTIKDAEKFYGQPDPSWTAVEGENYTVTGLQDGDAIPAFTITRSEGDEVGTYSLTATPTNPNTTKYATLKVSNGIFTIKKAHLTVTLPAQNLKKTDQKTALKKDDIVVTGIFNSDKAEDLYTLEFNTEASSGDGGIPTSALSSDAINVDNATYSKGYKLVLKTPVSPATVAASTRYDILVKYDASSETATYDSKITGKIIVGTGTGDGALELALSDAATDNLANIQGAVGETRTVKITLNRAQTIGGAEHNWKKGIWNCMVLPFKTSARQISKALGYAIVNVVNPSETTEGNVKFRLEMLEEIPANTPFFVKTDADLSALNAGTTDAGKAVFENVKIEAPESAYPSVLASSEALGYKFVGAYTKKTITGNNEEHLRWRLGDNNAWNKIGNGSTATWDIVPFNAYMDLGATAGAREIVFTFEEIDGTTTSIRSIDIDNVGNAKVSANGWYTLGGVKLNGAPTQKGVYIQDGKKVVIK